jgi:hypothetical protein
VPKWRSLAEIKIIPIPDHWRSVVPEVTKQIEKAVPKSSGFVQILVLDKLKFDSVLGVEDDDLRRVDRIPALDGFEKKLPKYLRGVGLDWLTFAESQVSKWRHGVVNKGRISLWLRQFAEAGSNEWVGEGLLRTLDFWPDDRLITSVAFTPEVLEAYAQICMHRQQSGKSADVLANLFQKQISPINPKFTGIEEFHTVLNSPKPETEGSKILFLEDGLFSGTEMSKILGDLLGFEIPPGRTRRAQPLTDKRLLKDRNITLLFPVATSFGMTRLQNFLQENDLPNITVECCSNLEVLNPQGYEALNGGTFFDGEIRNCPADPDAHFIRLPFENMTVWKDKERATKALNFCKVIGKQLFDQYLQSKNRVWTPDKVERCALGMFGMGLAFAFTHSVPKATIPLFWAGGKVKYQEKTINWVPLFPNAA